MPILEGKRIWIECVKGKTLSGNPLNEDNLNRGVLVSWRGRPYFTGNRYHDHVELFQGTQLVRSVSIKNVCILFCIRPMERRKNGQVDSHL